MICEKITQKYLKKILIIIVCISLFECSHPSDDSLILNFYNKREQIEQLRQMFLSDHGLYAVTTKMPTADASEKTAITPERKEEYRIILNYIGANEISGNNLKNIITIEVSFLSGILHGSYKGYLYDKNVDLASEYVVNSLDSYYTNTNGRSFVVLRHIEDDWYLYLEE